MRQKRLSPRRSVNVPLYDRMQEPRPSERGRMSESERETGEGGEPGERIEDAGGATYGAAYNLRTVGTGRRAS